MISVVMSSPSMSLRSSTVNVYSVLSNKLIGPSTVKSKTPSPSGSVAVATTGSPPPTGVQVKTTSVMISSSFSHGGASGSSATFTVKVKSISVPPSSAVDISSLMSGWCFKTIRKLPVLFSSPHSVVQLVESPTGKLFSSKSL